MAHTPVSPTETRPLPLPLSAVVHASAQVFVRELDGQAVLLDMQNARYYGLNKVGTRMWVLLSESHDMQKAYTQLLAEYIVDKDQLARDLTHFVDELARIGLLKVERGEG